jgi:hypothetical protein
MCVYIYFHTLKANGKFAKTINKLGKDEEKRLGGVVL